MSHHPHPGKAGGENLKGYGYLFTGEEQIWKETGLEQPPHSSLECEGRLDQTVTVKPVFHANLLSFTGRLGPMIC